MKPSSETRVASRQGNAGQFVQLFSTKAGLSLIGMVLICSVAVFFTVKSYFGKSEAEHLARDRTLVDVATGKPFNFEIQMGVMFPVKAPSGEMTGYPAEPCYWTTDGKPKSEPTWVVLNPLIGKPGPTYCPDCGRLVVSHNPRASSDGTPPRLRSDRAVAAAQ